MDVIGAVQEPDPENAKGVRYMINATQFVEVLPLPAVLGIVNRHGSRGLEYRQR